MKKLHLITLAMCAIAVFNLPLRAQYIGDQFPGLTGLKAGSQPGPGVYVTLPLFYRDSDITIHNAQGNEILKDFRSGIDIIALPSFSVVTPFKILGGTYGASYTQWIINGIVEAASTNVQRSTGFGFGDIYVQPATLGWHGSFGDATLGYAFFAPTGSGTSGQHMWVNEIDAGTTLYLDQKKWNASTMMYYDFNRRKSNTDVKVGNILTLAGGIGRSFLKGGAANAGLAYGAQWKMTHDSGSGIPSFLPVTNGRFFALGPEINMPVFVKGVNVGIVAFRYEWVVGPKTALGGQLLIASFTFAHLRAP